MTFELEMENALMGDILAGTEATTAATAWLKAHPETIEPWLEGVTTLEGAPGAAAVKAALGL
ncbi:hypothetical protein [Rhodobacter maris]|uniref:Substrate binding protein of glycine betaine ABC transport system n=1 Tax=Rhodobacter maris TaxID=446682 RepID=A0A285T7I2_9RHOB|nr:hypothetical protein SAMN05877831_11381 [Rhodobacter maris]